MGINPRFNLLKQREKNLKATWFPIEARGQRNLIRFLQESISEIKLKQQLFKKSLLAECDLTGVNAYDLIQKEKQEQD